VPLFLPQAQPASQRKKAKVKLLFHRFIFFFSSSSFLLLVPSTLGYQRRLGLRKIFHCYSVEQIDPF